MSYKFTQGPWTCHIAAKGGHYVVVQAMIGISQNEDLANSRLIAAAPDLIQALADLRNAIEEGKELALGDANRAIRKATGEPA